MRVGSMPTNAAIAASKYRHWPSKVRWHGGMAQCGVGLRLVWWMWMWMWWGWVDAAIPDDESAEEMSTEKHLQLTQADLIRGLLEMEILPRFAYVFGC